MTSRTASPLILLALLVSGCSAIGDASLPSPHALSSEASPEQRGLAFAQNRCAQCHAVKGGISPIPQVPTFTAVINTPGLDMTTLKPWLQNSHDFPAMMNFTIEPQHIDDLAAYMLTLKDPAYRPAIQ